MDPFISILFLALLAFVISLSILILTSVLGPKKTMATRLSVYECGVNPESSTQIPFKYKYYFIAIVFLIFDVETAFFFPWALIYRESIADGPQLLIAMAIYLFFFVLGLAYIVRKRAI